MSFCTKCGAEIRDDAKFCTSCGAGRQENARPSYPPPPPAPKKSRAKWYVIGGAVLVLLIIVIAAASAGGRGEDTKAGSPSANVSTAETKVTTTRAPESNSAGLNQPLTVGSIVWTATGAKALTKLHVNDGFTTDKTTTGRFIWVELTIKNTKKEAVTADSSFVSIVDSQGRKFESSTDVWEYVPTDQNLFLVQINPSMSASGVVIFEIPKDATGLQLSVGDLDIWGSKQGLINLGI